MSRAVFYTDYVYRIEYLDDDHVRLTPKGDPMQSQKRSVILAYAGWTSVFVEGWLLLLRLIPIDGISLSFFVLFFVLAIMASVIYSSKPRLGAPAADIRVRIGDQVFSEEAGNLTIRRNGNVILCTVSPGAVSARDAGTMER